MPCEDAPCCGCRSPNVRYQEDLAVDEARFESLDDDFYASIVEERQMAFTTQYGQPPCRDCGAPESACICEPAAVVGDRRIRTQVETFWNNEDYTTKVDYTYIDHSDDGTIVEHSDHATFFTSSWREGVNRADLWLREALA